MSLVHAITRDTLLETARSLPAAPQVMAGLCELLQDVNTDLEQIADAIRVDAALAGRVIRIGNSPVFGGGGRIGSIDEAVNRVGFAEVMRLVGTAMVAGAVDRALTCYGIPAERLRESLLLHALASEALAQDTAIEPRTAYVGGLLRGLGAMVLDRVARERLGPAEFFTGGRFETYAQWEASCFGLSAAEVTTMVLDEWRFPSELAAAVQEHLLPRASSLADPFACVLNLAGAIVAENDRALPGEAAGWRVTAAKLAAAGLDEERFAAASADARTHFERQRAALY